MKTNIVLIGFFKDLTNKVGEKLALDFGLYYADVEGLLEYNLMNAKEVEKLCGKDYLNGLKKKVIKDISNYENSVITMPYSIFASNNNFEMFRSQCTIVFFNFKKKFFIKETSKIEDKNARKAGEVFLLAYDERTKFCKDNSDITINMSKPEFNITYKKVKKCIDKYYL